MSNVVWKTRQTHLCSIATALVLRFAYMSKLEYDCTQKSDTSN